MRHPPFTISRRTACAAFAAAGAGMVGTALSQAGERPDQTRNAGPSAMQAASPVTADGDQRWAGRAITVSAWGGEVQQALRSVIWEPFADLTGCAIHERPADLSRFQASVESGAPYTDLLLVSGIWAETELGQALTAPFLSGHLTDRRFAPFAPSERSAPAFSYALVNSFRRDLRDRYGSPLTWLDWWDQTSFPGARSLSRSPLGTFEFALLADGVDPNELYPIDHDRALESLRRVRDAVSPRWWTDGFEPVGWLSSGAATLASAWHYRTIAGQRDGRAVDFDWQAGLLVADVWVSPVGSGNADIAADLVDFATSPPVQAQLSSTIPLGPVVPAALEMIEEPLAVWLPTFQPNLERLILYDPIWWSQNLVETTQRFDCWLGLGAC